MSILCISTYSYTQQSKYYDINTLQRLLAPRKIYLLGNKTKKELYQEQTKETAHKYIDNVDPKALHSRYEVPCNSTEVKCYIQIIESQPFSKHIDTIDLYNVTVESGIDNLIQHHNWPFGSTIHKHTNKQIVIEDFFQVTTYTLAALDISDSKIYALYIRTQRQEKPLQGLRGLVFILYLTVIISIPLMLLWYTLHTVLNWFL